MFHFVELTGANKILDPSRGFRSKVHQGDFFVLTFHRSNIFRISFHLVKKNIWCKLPYMSKWYKMWIHIQVKIGLIPPYNSVQGLHAVNIRQVLINLPLEIYGANKFVPVRIQLSIWENKTKFCFAYQCTNYFPCF